MTYDTGIRQSHHIPRRAASRFFKAARHATAHGRAFNLFVTINFTHTACPLIKAAAARTEICAKFTRWLKYQSNKSISKGQNGFGPPIYQTVLEAPNDIHHFHWMVHVPNELLELFNKTLKNWVEKVCGDIIKPDGLIHTAPIKTPMALSRYCMKGIEPYQAHRYYVRPINQGIVYGKRVTISRALGARARLKDTAQNPQTEQLRV